MKDLNVIIDLILSLELKIRDTVGHSYTLTLFSNQGLMHILI